MIIQTKEDLLSYFHQLFDPTKKYRQEKNGRLELGTSATHYSDDQAQIEGFLRLLWAAGPMAGNGSFDLKDFDYFKKAIIASTDPENPAYWGEVHDFDQLIVEMAALSVTLIETKKIFWDTLNPDQQKNLYNWLNQVNSVGVHGNNWRFFRILVNVTFQKLKQPYSQDWLEKDLAQIDSQYQKDGWYFDGSEHQQDYYIPWAFHYYGLLYAHYMKQEDPKHAQLFTARAKEFAKSFVYWFDNDGSAVAFGRSLTYRFAQGAFWSACVFCDVEVLPLEQIKYLLLQHFSYWSTLPIQKNDGILSIGYGYEDFYMAEQYNSPGSPYWAFKSFLILAVPEDHPFWKVTAMRPKRQEKYFLPAANMLITNQAGENVQLFPVNQNSPQIHAAEKYGKLVYSSRFSFSVGKGPRGLEQGAFDNSLAVAEAGTEYYFSKELPSTYEVTPEFTKQTWSPLPGVEITTTVVPFGTWHVRVHEINTARALKVADGGFSNRTFNGHDNDYEISELLDEKSFTSEVGTTAAANIFGYEEIQTIFSEPNSNLIFPHALYMAATTNLPVGRHVLISAHLATIGEATSVPTIDWRGKKLTITAGDQSVTLEQKN
ncbi:DUF2264 domain-containing protein [Enterococcus timonensis]|uniref:DUF2264 domain-containing protein n=1 Tax=Enterococcus timonensis TaxID=1852364 RepID=UPI0008D92178|nr:DUF2264 domain-containing protein [Enterococcus timonensis]